MKNTACCYNTIFEEQDAVAEALHNTIEVADKQIKDAEKRSIMVIFGDETLKPKEKGRNSDYSKEFYLRLKQQEYEKLEDMCQEKETQIKQDGRYRYNYKQLLQRKKLSISE